MGPGGGGGRGGGGRGGGREAGEWSAGAVLGRGRSWLGVAAQAPLCLSQHAGAAEQEKCRRRVYQWAEGMAFGQRQHGAQIRG